MHTAAVTSLLVCDTPAVGYAIRSALVDGDSAQVIKTVNKPSLMHGLMATLRPTAVILELSLWGSEAGDAITELAARHPDVRIVVYGEEAARDDSVEAGADAFVPVGASSAAICAAVRAIGDPRLAA
jgi:DNA-binding NarL/FixJ family response regulator